MRLWNLLLLLSIAPAANAGVISLTTPLSLSFTDGTTSSSITGTASDLSVTQWFNSTSGEWSAQATLGIPGTYNSGSIQQPSPLTFGLSNLYFYCGQAGGCSDELDLNYSFGLQIDSGFSELAGQPMSSSVSLSGSYYSNPAGSVTLQGSFTNSLSVASTYLRSFALTAFGFGNTSLGSSFTNAGAGSFGPSGSLGEIIVSGNVRLTGLSSYTEVNLSNLDFTFDATPSSVPEPGTLALTLLGAIACFWLVRRPAVVTALRRSSPRPVVPAPLAAASAPPGIPAGNAGAPEPRRNWTQD